MTLDTRAGRYGEELLEIDLASYVNALWQHRGRTLIIAAIAAAAAAGFSWMREPEYAATAMLAVAREENRPPPAVGMYTQLAQDTSAAADVIRTVGLDHGPRTLTPEALLADHLVVSAGRDLAMVTIEARMWTSELAAEVSNRMAEKVVARAAQIEAPTLAVLRAQSEAAKARFKTAGENLASASADLGPDWTASFFIPRGQGTADLAGAAAAARERAHTPGGTRDQAKYAAFVDGVGDYEVATRVYLDAAASYQRELLRNETRTITVQIVERAIKPDRPVPTRVLRTGVLGALAGLLIGALWVAAERVAAYALPARTTAAPRRP